MTLLDPHPPTRPARSTDRDVAVRILSEAFAHDPVISWMVPDAADRRQMLPSVFELFVDAFARHDETHVVPTADVVAGVALWAPPGTEPIHPDDETAFAAGLVDAVGPHMGRVGTVMELLAGSHPDEPAWYLQFLAVDPVVQGLGLGSRALRGVLERGDAAGEAAYLEATSERNRALYRRHGFRDVGQVALPDGPTLHAMWRDPAPVRS
ncbi:GNAT family N-acetyltransferase [Actinomarinicola tropica]|uniref:GNAT family N-acetyltransferase n=1 Tax=Actinomarinicola tropica TaxID=2789776 RepID=A0A5Q2RLF7_9ACTN|nr:GNAT family N-acetyltransferase [Actinomarinicola tropica]QGG95411.1 GNAT family N-acetyltransferase [Actinomarinicola tropica]